MGIERTDQWLRDHFYDPLKICSRLKPLDKNKSESQFYQYLLSFGMYRPNRMTKEIYHNLLKDDIWQRAEHIFAKYQEKWNGPDIPVYIFPFGKRVNSRSETKGGVSFKEGMFLFLSPFYKDEKELEALFVHEYHHVCRLSRLDKPFQQYTLLDSIVMEGFAEYAVTKSCGDDYNANWVSRYSDKELLYYWERDVKKHLQTKRTESLHDAILFGKGRYPNLLGYAIGYWLIENESKKKRFSIQDSFTIKSEDMLD